MPFVVETLIGSAWENIWTDTIDGVPSPTTFATPAEANQAIAEHNSNLAKAAMEEMDVRVVEVAA